MAQPKKRIPLRRPVTPAPRNGPVTEITPDAPIPSRDITLYGFWYQYLMCTHRIGYETRVMWVLGVSVGVC